MVNPMKDAERLAAARLASIRIRHSGNSEDRGCDYCFLVKQIARLTQERDDFEGLYKSQAAEYKLARERLIILADENISCGKERDAALASLAAKSQHYEGMLRELEMERDTLRHKLHFAIATRRG
jgi:hypothetical protein